MKEDQEESGRSLVPSASSALTRKSSGLVRRGLDDLLNRQSRIDPSDADKVPRLKVGQKVFTSSGIPAEIAEGKSSARGPVYRLTGSPKIAGKQWRQDELTKFDEEKYAKAKVLFEAGMNHVEGKTPVDKLRGLVASLRADFRLGDDTLKPMKPYMLRFIGELKAGMVLTEEDNEQSSQLQYHRIPGFEPDSKQVEIFRELIRESKATENWARLAELADEIMKMSEDPDLAETPPEPEAKPDSVV